MDNDLADRQDTSKPLNINKIEIYKSRYVGSGQELLDIKKAYQKYNGNIRRIFQDISFVENNIDKKRIKDIIHKMIEDNEIPPTSIMEQKISGRSGKRTTIRNLKCKKVEKEMKTIILSNSEPIVIEDSDTGITSNIGNIFLKKKRRLAQAFSDDEDNVKGTFSEPLHQSKPINLPTTKRILSHSFDESDTDGEGDITDKLEDDFTRPMSCSTPFPVTQSSLPEIFQNYYHVSYNDISTMSQLSRNEIASTSDMDSDTTVITSPVHLNRSDETTICITQNLIVTPGSKSMNCNAVVGRPGKKRSASDGDHKSVTNKTKTNVTNDNVSPPKKSCLSFSGVLSGLKDVEKENTGSQQAHCSKFRTNSSSMEPSQKAWSSSSTKSSKEDSIMKTENLRNSSKKTHRKNETKTGQKIKTNNSQQSSQIEKINAKDKTLPLKETKNKHRKPVEKNSELVITPVNAAQKSQSTSMSKSEISIKSSSKTMNESQPSGSSLVIRKSVIERTEVMNSERKNGKETTSNTHQPTQGLSRSETMAKVGASEKKQESKNKNRIDSSKATGLKSSPCKKLVGAGSSLNYNLKPKKEERKINKEPLILMIDLFKGVFSSKHVNNLLTTERKMIRIFLDMKVEYQFVCLKLITRQKKWYNVFKFCELIYLDMEETDISDIYSHFEENGIVDTDYSREGIPVLLNHLCNTDLRSICNNFKLNKKLQKKEEMISSLLKYSKSQSTLTVQKTTSHLLMEEIQNRMGRCMRINQNFFSAFNSVYLLGTFTNSRFSDMKEFFLNILQRKVIFPEFPIDDYIIFSSRTDFVSYAKARQYLDELENQTDHNEKLQICRTIFNDLKALEKEKNNDERFREAPHLIRFTARAVYVSALSKSAETLYCKFPEDVKTWLEYMIAKVDFPHKIGQWYYDLVWLYMRYLKPFNYDRAAELLQEVLRNKKEHLSKVQYYHLRKRGEQLISTKKYKILQANHDEIVKLLPKRIKVKNFPVLPIDAKTIRSNDPGRKRDYFVRDNEGNKTILGVEDVALTHYLDILGYTGGEHCEGSIIKATFTLFFFDIIYSVHKVVPGTFVSKIQSEPLDMNSRYFYKNRKEEIDKRLKEIECEWSDERLMKFVNDNYEKHSHEFAVCEIGVIIKEPQFLETFVNCVGRKVLAKIYQRLVENFREYRSGLPDLFVWNTERKECKFVEVKGENDKLSVGQALWLEYLQSIGARIEVCLVHSIGSKRKKIKTPNESTFEEPSTSSTGTVP